MGTALVILSAIEAFTSTGFEAALVQRRSDVEQFYDSAFTMQVVRGICLAVLLWLTAPAAAAFFGGPTLVPVLRAVGLVLILRGFVNPAKLRFMRELRYDTLFWWTLPEVVVSLVLAIGLGVVLRNVWALVITVIGSQAIATVVSHLIARRRPRFALDWSRIREIVHYSKWVFATHIMDFLIMQGDNAFIAKALGLGPLGFYQVAFRVAELPVRGFTQVVGDVGLPSLSALQSERDRLTAWYFAAQRVVLLVQAIFVVPILLFGGPLTHALLGPRWMPIVPTLKILAVAMVLRSFLVIASTLFNALGEPRFSYQMHAARAALMALTMYPLARFMGLEGVATAVLISVTGATLVYVRMLRASMSIRWVEHFRRLL